jgi:hypothetical protein
LKKAYYLVLGRMHLSTVGLEKIVAIKASLNKGLSSKLEAAAFPQHCSR